MKIYTKKIENEEIVKKINIFHNKTESMQRVIKLCLDDRFFNVDNEKFKAFYDEYENALKQFNEAKSEFEKTEIFPDFAGYNINWYIDYSTYIATVEVLDDE